MWKPRLKPLPWRRILTEGAILLAIVFVVHLWQTRRVVSGRAPAFSAPLLDGGTFSSASIAGKPTVVHFWATWCGVCKAEEGNVQSLAEGGDVVTVASSSGEAEAVRRHMRERGLSFPVVLDPEGEIARRFGVSAYPTSLFLDRDGDVRFAEVGYTTTAGMKIRRWLSRL